MRGTRSRPGAGAQWALAALALCAAVLRCDASASRVDGGDLHGVFERDGGAPSTASGATATGRASAAPSASASASATATSAAHSDLPNFRRKPIAGPCLRTAEAATEARPGTSNKRPAGRPGCRGARILEWRDGGGDPRYGCVIEPEGLEKRAPLPLIVFFHADVDTPKAVDQKTRLRSRGSRVNLSGDPAHEGFVVLAPQGRRRGGRIRFDTVDPSAGNLDLATTDHFVEALVAEGVVDRRRIYAVGDGSGGRMAMFYALARPALVAAFGMYAADGAGLEWTCAEAPPAGWLGYRSCDAVASCEQLEQWLDQRRQQGAALATLRLDDGRREEPSCDRSRRCKGKRAEANHARWPKEREEDLLEFLGRFSLDVPPTAAPAPNR